MGVCIWIGFWWIARRSKGTCARKVFGLTWSGLIFLSQNIAAANWKRNCEAKKNERKKEKNEIKTKRNEIETKLWNEIHTKKRNCELHAKKAPPHSNPTTLSYHQNISLYHHFKPNFRTQITLFTFHALRKQRFHTLA